MDANESPNQNLSRNQLAAVAHRTPRPDGDPMPNQPALRRRLVAENQTEFGLHYLALKFPSRQQRTRAAGRRLELLARIGDRLRWTAGDSKPHLGPLSPGCRLCVAGSWSCLFINASCNARCFYCPTPQDRRDIPATNNLTFRHPEAYATYLRRLGFRGASISGGEPLLTLNRTLAFLRAARQALGPRGHLWLYTNGILLTREIAGQLAAAGLDEIRFDIGATGYQCRQLSAAAGLIPTLSIEIPAVPEALPTLSRLLPTLPGLGVNHLNLHQLRLTRHNFLPLTERNYTFLHGTRVTVLESELAALEILALVRRNGLPLPVNYCSFVFKNRHQNAAARRRAAQLELRPRESVTAAGFIRKLALHGDADQLQRQAAHWRQAGQPSRLWKFVADPTRLELAPRLLPTVNWHRLRLAVGYDQVSLGPQGQPERGDWSLPLDPGSQASVLRRSAGPEILLGRSAAERFQRIWLAGEIPETLPVEQRVFCEWENIPQGLQDYF